MFAIASFQFLLVRLKGKRKKNKRAKSNISIPFGAIKRPEEQERKEMQNFNFNSFWCD